MINKVILPAALSLLLLTAPGFAQEQELLKPEVVVRVLQTAFPDLPADVIKVKMIKRLTSRVKVNLEIEGRNAILYLTWQRSRTGARWWFERDADRSLVYLSKTTQSARSSAARAPRGSGTSEAAEAAGGDRLETVAVGIEVRREPDIAGAGEEEKAEPSLEGKPEPETPPAETEEAAAEAPSEEPPAGKTGERVDLAAGTPISLATGPTATSKQFISALVTAIARGKEENYAEFVLRASELGIRVEQERYKASVDGWMNQCRQIHTALKEFGNITIDGIVLQRPPMDREAEATLLRLRKVVPSVVEAYTYVKIHLHLDDRPAYISIRGLMRIEEGWRVGGRIELVLSDTIDLTQ